MWWVKEPSPSTTQSLCHPSSGSKKPDSSRPGPPPGWDQLWRKTSKVWRNTTKAQVLLAHEISDVIEEAEDPVAKLEAPSSGQATWQQHDSSSRLRTPAWQLVPLPCLAAPTPAAEEQCPSGLLQPPALAFPSAPLSRLSALLCLWRDWCCGSSVTTVTNGFTPFVWAGRRSWMMMTFSVIVKSLCNVMSWFLTLSICLFVFLSCLI